MNNLSYGVWEKVKEEITDGVKSGNLFELSGDTEFMNDLQEVLDYIAYPNISFYQKYSKRNIFLQTIDLDPEKIPYNITSISIMQMLLIGFSDNGPKEMKQYGMEFLTILNKSCPSGEGEIHKKLNFMIEKLYEHVFDLWSLHSVEIGNFQKQCAEKELEEAKKMEEIKDSDNCGKTEFIEPRNEDEAKKFSEKLKDLDKKSPEEIIKNLQSMMK